MSGRINLEDQIRRAVGYWCNKLVQSQFTYKLPTDFQADLEAMCWLKVLQPKVWDKIREIWFSPDPNRGGVRGVSKFLSVLCTNTYIDEYRKAKWEPSLDELANTRASFEKGDEPMTLLDIITHEESEESTPFLFSDLQEMLTPEEYEFALEYYIKGATFRDMAADRGRSKSAIDRWEKRIREKVESFIEQAKAVPRPVRHAALPYRPLFTRPVRPDRISAENREHWQDVTRSMTPFYSPLAEPPAEVPFRLCGNEYCQNGNLLRATVEAVQGADGDWYTYGLRYSRAAARELLEIEETGLCTICYLDYWRSLMEQIEADLMDWVLEPLVRPSTPRIIAPGGTKRRVVPFFITRETRLQGERFNAYAGQVDPGEIKALWEHFHQ